MHIMYITISLIVEFVNILITGSHLIVADTAKQGGTIRHLGISYGYGFQPPLVYVHLEARSGSGRQVAILRDRHAGHRH